MPRKLDKVVLVKGAGEVASGIACRLYRCNFRVVLLELPEPRTIRRAAAFAEAAYDGRATVEGLQAYLCETAHEARIMAERGGMIPLLVDPQADTVPAFGPIALVDARMMGSAAGTTIEDAPLVVGIGPGFLCGRDVHLVVESCGGPRLGRVLAEGEASPDPEVEGVEAAVTAPTCVLAPAAGAVVHAKRIGDLVEPNEVLCRVEGAEARSRIGGRVSGLIHEGIRVERGWRVAAIDPLGSEARPEEIGFRPLAIAGGVLEAMLSYLSVKVRI
jgi:xanthine dehydrogenase accessory factor